MAIPHVVVPDESNRELGLMQDLAHYRGRTHPLDRGRLQGLLAELNGPTIYEQVLQDGAFVGLDA